MTIPSITLTPVQLQPENIQEKIICIRAHRERIFRVSAQIEADKLVCHNYGQGGAGWTFLFGCVNESIRLFEEQLQRNPRFKNKPIVVIGAGCYGLLTAILLARKGYAVRIVAAQTENIASYKAAGFFFPRPRRTSTAQEIAQFQACGLESYATYVQILKGEHPFIAHGPKVLPAYFSLDVDPGFAPYIKTGLVKEPRKVAIHFGNDKRYEAMKYEIVFINPGSLMAELVRNQQALAITLERKIVTEFSELDESIIFNCAGLGAKQLSADKTIIPVQGHLITLTNQSDVSQLQYMINVRVGGFNERGIPRNDLIYYAPKDSGILGITFLRGTDSLTSNHHEFDRLIKRCQEFFGK